jgi:threonine dehydratase
MPPTTPAQKIKQVGMFGKEFVKIELVGDTYDDMFYASKKIMKNKTQLLYIHLMICK